MTIERLSGMDATFLYVETPSNQTHMTGVLVFDPSTMKEPYSFDRMREYVRSRLGRAPAFTRKLARVPFDVAHPVWVDDADFDLEAHLHRVAAPSPGGPRELGELAGQIAGWPLDRNRPLWDMWFVEGLEEGHVALVAKMHHSTIDGVSGANLMMHLFDLEPDPPPVPEEPAAEPQPAPADLELLLWGLWSRARRPLLLPRAMVDTARAGVELVRRRIRPGAKGMAAPFSAPPTPFNAPITGHRRVAFCSVAMADVQMIRHAFGTTVNDVILAVCGGAIRRWLERRDALPDRPLVAGVPVSTRGDEDGGGGGFGANLISAMFVSLATDVDDPLERLQRIHDGTRHAKEEFRAVGADVLTNWTEFSGPRLFGLAVRLYSRMELADRHPPALNFIVSNVPGPPIPLYLAGGRLVALYPLGPVFDGMGLNVTVLSYMDTVGFGFLACRELIPDLWDLAGFVDEALEELKARAKQSGDRQQEDRPAPGRSRSARTRPAPRR
ncbi:MAG TPA: wax ester/triacylglycerol synthase family O-acyltransferase [Acidimicrobiales bacterium]|nr:wax ester/triacylglycerol synthase family O-acyltransferase [Acidimicrobiales bacterium]